MNTNIDDLINENCDLDLDKDGNINISDNSDDSDESDDQENNLLGVVINLSHSLDRRVKCFEEYYNKRNDNAVEALSTLAGMYQMSGSKLIEQFFYHICMYGKVSSFLKLEAAKNILDYKEMEEGSDSDEDEEEREIRIKNDEIIRDNNKKRTLTGYKCLDYICSDLSSIPTPCRIDAIFMLMESEEFKSNVNSYFCEFVCDKSIECDFRYKTILSLENIGSELMKNEIIELFEDKNFVEHMYNNLKHIISNLFPNIKPNIKNRKFWDDVIFQLSYEDICNVYKEKFPIKPTGRDFYITKAQLAFLFCETNRTCYRILSGQYLLRKCKLSETNRFQVEAKILNFAKDEELDYNLRADAADLLLNLASDNMKENGKNIITELAKKEGVVHTLFDNAQNVHTETVEKSVFEALEFLNSLTLYKINKKPIDFVYVNHKIEKMLKTERDSLYKKIEQEENMLCDHCKSVIKDIIKKEKNNFCSNTCLRFYFRDEKIRIALNRIFMDRALYSKYNNTLVSILLKVYTYIITQDKEDIKQEMYKRLLEELEEMSGTCSSGFASRLINILSGFGDFNIRISYEEQIVSNFIGRLNAVARKITDKSSIFRNEKLNSVVELWLNHKDNQEIKNNIEEKLNPSKDMDKRPSIKNIIDDFLTENRDEKINNCIEDFANEVLNEMTMSSLGYCSRQNFSLFFNSYVSIIREELALEFKDLIDDSEFDMAFRRALIVYDGDI